MKIIFKGIGLFGLVCLCFGPLLTSLEGKANGTKTVLLEVKKTLEIDSSVISKESSWRGGWKDLSANRILLMSDRPGGVYIFDNDGNLKGQFLLSQGEGPREIRSFNGMQIIKDEILLYSSDKTLFYTLDGQYKREVKHAKQAQSIFHIDAQRLLGLLTDWDGAIVSLRTLAIWSVDKGQILAEIMKDPSRKDIGSTMVEGQSCYHDWITPDYKYVYFPESQQIVCGLSDGRELYLKNTKGETQKKSMLTDPPMDMSDDDHKSILETFKKIKDNSALYNGLKNKIPKKIFQIMWMKKISKDHFVLFMGVGYEKYAVKIFNRQLEYIADLEFPQELCKGIGDVSGLRFTNQGFYYIESGDETSKYLEYKILNLKEVFN